MSWSSIMATVFLHIPKTGGTTLRHLLYRQYAGKPTYTIDVVKRREGDRRDLKDTGDFLALPEREKKRIELLLGHMNFGLHEELESPVMYFSFIRKPEARVISSYDFVMRSEQHPLHAEYKAKYPNIEAFVEDPSQHDVHNRQIRMISGTDGSEEEMLGKALDNVEKWFAVVGILERFDDSLLLMQRHFGWTTPWYEIRQKKKKSDGKKKRSAKLMTMLSERNRGDLAFYRAMEERLDAQLKEVPSSSLWLQRKALALSNEYHSSKLGRRASQFLNSKNT